MSEKKTLSQWLRQNESYEPARPEPAHSPWRDALLAEFEHPSTAPRAPREPEGRAPLQWHHLALMAPAGATLFGLGWLSGNESLALTQMAQISPLVWTSVVVAGSLSFLAWRGLSGLGRR